MLRDVTLGVSEGDRIGVVGDNGAGKSTLLRLLAGAEAPDDGSATRTTGLHAALVGQHVDLDPDGTVRAALVGGRPDDEWARDAEIREVLGGLLGGVAVTRFPQGLETPTGQLSGGEQRRVMLARALLDGSGAAPARRAHQPSRHRGDRVAGRVPGRPPRHAGGDHPRPVVPGRGRRDRTWEVAGGGVYSTTAAIRRTCWRAPSATARPRCARTSAAKLAAQGAGLAAPGAAGAHVQAEVPDRRGQRADRRRAAAARHGCSCCASPPRGSASGCSTSIESAWPRRPPAAVPRHLAARARASGSAWSAPTALARSTLLRLLAGDGRRTPGRCSAARRSRWPT